MAKRTKPMKKISSRPIGALIKQTIKQLKAVRPDASKRAKKRIDLHIKVLHSTYTRLIRDCKGLWTLPNPSH